MKIYYRVFAKGPPLFLHVGALLEWDYWKLAGYTRKIKDHTLIVIDPRGRGKSDKPRDLSAHKIENYVSDVVKILDDLGIKRTAFWGHSDGARVGFVLALKYPKRVSALIAAGGQDGQGEYRKWRLSFARIARSKTGVKPIEEAIAKEYRRLFGRSYPKWYRNNRPIRDPEILALNMLAWKDWIEKWNMYHKIKVPTLVIAGEKEDPSGIVHRIANLMPNARSVLLKGETHGSEFLKSDLALRYVRPFLNEHNC